MKSINSFGVLVTIAMLAGCNTMPNSKQANQFEDLYFAANSPNFTYIAVASESQLEPKLNFYSRSTCRFAHPELFAELGPRPIVSTESKPPETKEAGTLATLAANLAVKGVTAFLKAAGSDRTETTPIKSSFEMDAKKPTSPKCFEITKNAGRKGQFILELGFQESNARGTFRLIPIFFAFEQKAKRHILNAGRRNIAVQVKINEPGKTDAVEVKLNLGSWREGEITYFNKNAYISNEPNISLSSEWFNLSSTDRLTPLNIELTVLETTSGSKLAKIFAAEIEENKATLQTQLSDLINKPDITYEQTVSARDEYESKKNSELCVPLEAELNRIIETGDYNVNTRTTLERDRESLASYYGDEFPEIRNYAIYEIIQATENPDNTQERKDGAKKHYDDVFTNVCSKSSSN